MKNRRQWWRVLIAVALAAVLLPTRSFAFVESTETDGELPSNISGVWMLVSHIEFTKPTPTPEPGATPAPSPGSAAGEGASGPVRYFNVVNLVRVVHYVKAEADMRRAGDRKMEEASAEKAKALLAADEKKSLPVQTEGGEVVNEAKVIVPTVPARRQPGTGDDLDIYLLDVAFPQEIQDDIDKAQKAEKRWVPNAKTLAALKASLNALKPSGRDEYSKIEWKVFSAAKYDDNFTSDPTTKDAKFAISANEEMIPKPNVPKTNILIYGIEDIKPAILSGKHTRAMMASAPFPLPIEMHGTFKMYKVAELPKSTPAKPTPSENAAPAKKQGAKKP